MSAFLKKSFATLFVLLFTVGLLELGAHAAFRLALVPPEAVRVVDVLRNVQSLSYATGKFENGDPVSLIAPRAYYLYVNAPSSGTKKGIQVTPEGYRNGEEKIEPVSQGKSVSQGKPAFQGLRILALGGSTTYGWMLDDYRDAWPARLEAILKKKFSFPVQVINAGLPGGTSAESLVGYSLRDQFFKPDLVIIHNGGNDTHPLFFADYSPDYATYRTMVTSSLSVRPGERYLLSHSALARLVYAAWLRKESLGAVQTQPSVAPSLEESVANVKRNEPLGFSRNMTTLLTLILAQGGQPVLFPFYLADKAVFETVPEPMRYAAPTYEPLTLALEKNKKVLRQIAKEKQVPLFELAPNSIPLTAHFDHCHLKAEGEEIKASFMAEKLAPLLVDIANRKGLAAK